MTYTCIEMNTGKLLGECTLSPRQHDTCGTEHMFGDAQYVLRCTHIFDNKGTMYFTKK